MEENEYKNTYNAINQLRCIFEKAILSRSCDCALSTRFCLADREGVSCNSARAQDTCHSLLKRLRENALFALKITHLNGPLPHAKEIRVQRGGVLGLLRTLHPELAAVTEVENIRAVVLETLDRYGSLDELPYPEIVKAVVSFEGHRKRSQPHPDKS